MGTILGFILALLFVGAALLGFYFYRKYNKRKEKKFRSGVIAAGVVGLALFVMFVFIPFGFQEISTGEIAVVKVWGEAKEVKTEGLHFRNIVSTRYEIYDLKTQDVRTTFESYTKDGQAVTVQLTTQFRIRADKVIEINKQFGSLEILKQRVDAIGIVGAKEVISTYEAMILIQQRSVISLEVAAKIGDGFVPYHIDVTQILVTDIAFTKTFEDMIDQKKVAEQELEKAKIDLARQLAEAENKVKLAEAEAKEKLAKAQGEADAIEALAKAEAKKIAELAKAEAAAIRVKSIELARSVGINIETDAEGNEVIDANDPNIALLEPYLKYIAFLEAWNGELPNVVGGDWSILFPVGP